ncbi:hypothetical protein AVEN_115180-1 [Araneus ventricosus]|uniref:Tc1-like transposase DDE domain-containing protein n=1 Tax=Araneus ventricosus TaxID=182803 RepID=A0A4Y1ZXR3_ARAVE|nr:hypothetical protein AVEN_115180-1 [Araneus ventricosus]
MMLIGSSVDYVRSGGMRNVPFSKAVKHLYATTAKFSGCVLLASRPAYSYPPRRIGPVGSVTCTVNGVRYESLLRSHVIPALQQSACVGSTIFMPDGAPPHIANPVKRVLCMHFGNNRTIRRHFPTNWPPRSPDLNPCDFWLWGYFKHVVFCDPIANIAELKTRIAQRIYNISTDILRSVV